MTEIDLAKFLIVKYFQGQTICSVTNVPNITLNVYAHFYLH